VKKTSITDRLGRDWRSQSRSRGCSWLYTSSYRTTTAPHRHPAQSTTTQSQQTAQCRHRYHEVTIIITSTASEGDWRLSTHADGRSTRRAPIRRPIMGFWGARFPKMGDTLPRTPMNHHAKFNAASFILAGEIRSRTHAHTHTHKQTNSKWYIHTLPIGMCG